MHVTTSTYAALRSVDLLAEMDPDALEGVFFALQMRTGDYSAESQLGKALLLRRGEPTTLVADVLRILERLEGQDLAWADDLLRAAADEALGSRSLA